MSPNLATRRPTETTAFVVGLLTVVLVRVFRGDWELAAAVAGLLALLPSAVTWLVEMRRSWRGLR